MVDNELAFAAATDLLKLISTKQISPVELTELYFDRKTGLTAKRISAPDPRRSDGDCQGCRGSSCSRRRIGDSTRTAHPYQGYPNDQGDTDDVGFGGIQGPDTGAGFSGGGAGAGSRGYYHG